MTDAERDFDQQFKEWEAKFAIWKEENKNHPDKVCEEFLLSFTSAAIFFLVVFFFYRSEIKEVFPCLKVVVMFLYVINTESASRV